MKKLLGLLVFGTAAAIGLAQETLSRRLTPEEYRRAGLGKLSPSELTQLEALFKKYGSGWETSREAPPPVPPVQTRSPAPATAVQEPAPSPITQPETPTPPVPGAANEGQNKAGGLFSRIRKTTPAPESQPKAETTAIETEIDGNFTGWEEMTVWTMKDGSVWRVDNRPRPYFTSRVANPRVRIYPAMLNGYWVEFVDLKTRVRVVRLK